MCSTAKIQLEIAHKKIDELQQEIEDCREFVKSVSKHLTSTAEEQSRFGLNPNKYNLQVMCDYLMNRYIN